MHRLPPTIRRRGQRRGFTLTELLVAVAVLLVVIIATARIFGTVTKVTGAGQANADLLQTAQTIERQIRADLANLSRDGFMLIESVEVPNNVNGAASPLLNSALATTATLRCDRLVFFVEGQFSSTQFAGSQAKHTSGGDTFYPNKQATAARIYYGHGVQLKNADPLTDAFLPLSNNQPLLPWTFDSPADGPDLSIRNWNTGAYIKDINASQPGAREWILARQPILLADDGVNGFLLFNSTQTDPKNSTVAIWFDPVQTPGANFDPGPLSSRVDIAGSTLDKIRQTITNFGTNNATQQRTQILRALNNGATPNTLRFPRAEKVAPSMDRMDQMLTNPTLAANCSSFIVEWTWADRTGLVKDNSTGIAVDPSPANPGSGDEWVGVVMNGTSEQPWFGLPDASRGVYSLSQSFFYNGNCNGTWGCFGLPIYPVNVEGSLTSGGPLNNLPVSFVNGQGSTKVYRASFGLNQTRAYDYDPSTNQATVFPNLNYTPWPTALRFTITLHDPQQRFTEGRTFQFVVELPRR